MNKRPKSQREIAFMEKQRREATNTTPKTNVVPTVKRKDAYQMIARGGGKWWTLKTFEKTGMAQAEQHSREKTRD